MSDHPAELTPSQPNQRPASPLGNRLQFSLLVVTLSLIAFLVWWIICTIIALSSSSVDIEAGIHQWPDSELTHDFNLENVRIPKEEIHAGGPPIDGIPSLTDPQFVSAEDATFLKPRDQVIGIYLEGQAKAYPLSILNYHEAVNDHIGGIPIAVTYCPLCDSSVVYDRRIKGQEMEFGISGLLYNSNALLYDRNKTGEKSLWSQLKKEAVSGPAAGTSLKLLPLDVTTWADWSTRHPRTLVLSVETGHDRDYTDAPYELYFQHPDLMFPAKPLDKRLPAKTRILGVWNASQSRAYPLPAFEKFRERTEIPQTLGGLHFTLEYRPTAQSLRVVYADDGLEWMYSFWFAWAAFHQKSEIGKPSF